MLDFLIVSTRAAKHGVIEVYPRFRIMSSDSLMIRGGDFYAIWNDETNLWCTDEDTALYLIDKELDRYAEEHKAEFDNNVRVLHMWDSDTGMIDKWHKYCQKQTRDHFHSLDEKLIFADTETKKEDYASKKLPYPLKEGSYDSYEELISTLYSEEERHKIEWAIGAIVSGDSKKLQKFMVLYGSAGTGKSTILNIIQDLFDGYYSVFDAKALGMNGNSFALESFKSNPLVAIQHDGDLSRIEDNTRLNSIVSHELMTVNEKFRSAYSNRFNCFLFVGTNRPVKITDAKSGIIRRLIDVSPSGNKLSPNRYKQITHSIKFELGAIACHCRDVYLENPGYYDDYIPVTMLGASNDFYNFILDSYDIFKNDDGVSLKVAWEMYKAYCEDAKVQYSATKRVFQEELKNYFRSFEERAYTEDGSRVRNYYSGFVVDKFKVQEHTSIVDDSWLSFKNQHSLFDDICKDCQAQYGNSNEIPTDKWDNVKTTLKELDTSKLHYVRVPLNHIIIDFDIKDENGKKSFELNKKAAEKWPKTYAELSKSGQGIHLHYIYDGDPEKLKRIYDENIEIKVYTGKSSLRRMLTKCVNNDIYVMNSGLPIREDNKVVDFEGVENAKHLRALINKNLRKLIFPNTKPSMDLIYKTVEDAYKAGLEYDISDMRPVIQAFASGSSHQADYCLKLACSMHYCSDNQKTTVYEETKDDELTFFDVEVYPNLFVVVFKNMNGKPVRLINPSSIDIENLLKKKLVGFNNRRYDNHILYGRLIGYNNLQLFNLSQNIISQHSNAFFGDAYNLSYTDVYDFASAGNKQSLKKWEIELGIHHQEMDIPWDQPVPESLWDKVAEYCENDVIATQETFLHLKGDWEARQMLAAVANMSVNDTTNTLTTRIIFGKEKHPHLVYTDLATGKASDPEYERNDVINAFPGYEFVNGHNMYRGEDVGKGGYVYAEPGMYGRVLTFDVASMHPSSIVALNLFGEYTKRFKEIMDARIAIKHKDFEAASKMLNGSLAPFLKDPASAKAVANALKTAINSVYGLTSASFDNAFRDPRNANNIVALRGALFMVNLKHEIQDRGYTVVHCKTDSIKIANPDKKIFDFVMDYGHKYGYNFEIEHSFERICLVNNAVYIAKLADDDPDEPGKWTATGAQFAHPYIFKTLFSKEPLVFSDLCETKSVQTTIVLDMDEGLPEGEHNYIFVGKVGSFCPIKPGCGGGRLLRKANEDKYDSVNGAKGYRWLEAEIVGDKAMNREKDIDMEYFRSLADDAISSISEFGDYYRFVAEEPYD